MIAPVATVVNTYLVDVMTRVLRVPTVTVLWEPTVTDLAEVSVLVDRTVHVLNRWVVMVRVEEAVEMTVTGLLPVRVRVVIVVVDTNAVVVRERVDETVMVDDTFTLVVLVCVDVTCFVTVSLKVVVIVRVDGMTIVLVTGIREVMVRVISSVWKQTEVVSLVLVTTIVTVTVQAACVLYSISDKDNKSNRKGDFIQTVLVLCTLQPSDYMYCRLCCRRQECCQIDSNIMKHDSSQSAFSIWCVLVSKYVCM